MQVMLAASQSCGTRSDSSETWKISVRGGAVLSVRVFKTTLGMPSGPDSLLTLRLHSSLAMPGAVTVMGCMWAGGGFKLGSVVMVVLVKTDLNWCSKMLALD